jgi:hypothetical protein|mmetsp:Transcript_8929/g.1289  ORF Transcript_8929/g.1289 Transcript_8929/m.1289 type:complete len:153 (-) Transcript_8929:187-645(-)
MRTRKEMGPVEKQAKLDAYDNPLEDYLEMVIQYGYVVLFCAAFPLLPLMALIEIIIEIRVDAIKICTLTRRPYPESAEDIGVWKIIISCVSFFGTITNAGIIVFATGAFDDCSHFIIFLSFLVIEHIFIMFKIIIDVGIQDEPDKVTDGYKW